MGKKDPKSSVYDSVLRGDMQEISSWEMATLKATNLCGCVGGRGGRLLLKYECPKCHHPFAKGPESKNID